jgi:phthiodiolone/phenolphthiodiolone dimycocerosates ketoreductase
VGTPEQVTARLREFGDAGLRHVVLGPLSAFITVRDLVHAGWAVRRIARSLRTG